MGKPASFEKLVRKAREAEEAERAEARRRRSEPASERLALEALKQRAIQERSEATSGLLWEDVDRVVNSLTIAKVLPTVLVFDPKNLPEESHPLKHTDVHTGESRSDKRRDAETRRALSAKRTDRIEKLEAMPKIPSWATYQTVALGLQHYSCGERHITERPLYVGNDRNLYFADSLFGQLGLRDSEWSLPVMAEFGQVLPARDEDIGESRIPRLTADGIRAALASFVVTIDLQLYDVVPVQAAV